MSFCSGHASTARSRRESFALLHRTDSTVQATLRVAGRDDFVEEWPLGTLVTVVRGP